MKYIRNFNNHRKFKLNEEFIGNALKNLMGEIKKRASLKLSKEIGSAKKVETVIEKYKEELVEAMGEKLELRKKILTYHQEVAAGADPNEDELKEMNKNLEKLEDNYNKEKEILKKKYNQEFNDIISEEKDPNIKKYLKLRKLEMAQELLAIERKKLFEDLDKEDLDTEYVDELNKSLEEKAKKLDEMTDELADQLEQSSEEGATFNFEEAQKSSDYLWKDSPFMDSKFDEGDEIKYWSNSNFDDKGEEYQGTTAYIGPDEKQTDEMKKDGEIWVYTDENDSEKGFTIKKGKIITTKKYQEEKKKEQEGGEEQEVEI